MFDIFKEFYRELFKEDKHIVRIVKKERGEDEREMYYVQRKHWLFGWVQATYKDEWDDDEDAIYHNEDKARAFANKLAKQLRKKKSDEEIIAEY